MIARSFLGKTLESNVWCILSWDDAGKNDALRFYVDILLITFLFSQDM